MKNSIFLLAILTHLLSDFVLQTETHMNKRISFKLSKSIFANITHSLIHFSVLILTYIAYIKIGYPKSNYLIPSLIFISLFIAISHFIIDQLKSFCIVKGIIKNKVNLFFMDQICHLIMIYIISNLYVIPSYLNKYSNIILVGIIFLSSTVVTGIIIRIIMEQINDNDRQTSLSDNFILNNNTHISILCSDEQIEAKDGGFWIGILERLFIVTVILLNQPMMIGFVLTAKSIARFKKLDDDRFAEYYIIGTLISFLTAIIGGYAISYIFKIPAIL